MGSLYGYEVTSELPLRRLNSAPGRRGALVVEAVGEPLAQPRGAPTSTLVDSDGQLFYASHELDGRCLLELPPSGEFLLDPDGGRVSVDVRDGDSELLEHRIASAAICTLLAMRGDLVLHASGVECGGAVVFCGPSRRGKSTLARVLGELGYPLLAEDGVAVSLDGERPTAFPGARGVRAHPDENGAPAELTPDPGPAEPDPAPVTAIVLLRERAATLAIERIDPARAVAMFTSHLIHSGGRDSIAAAFARLARLVATVPTFAATLPDDLDALPGNAARLLDMVTHRG